MTATTTRSVKQVSVVRVEFPALRRNGLAVLVLDDGGRVRLGGKLGEKFLELWWKHGQPRYQDQPPIHPMKFDLPASIRPDYSATVDTEPRRTRHGQFTGGRDQV